MIQCADCEFGKQSPDGNIRLTCDPARNIKEPECLTKWMLKSLWNIEQMQAQTLSITNNMLPFSAKVLQHNCAQIDELQKGEDWKQGGSDEDEPAG